MLPAVATALQFALVVALLWRFKLETQAFRDVALLALAGFVVHSTLPVHRRMGFFLLLSALATVYVLGLEQHQWQVALALSRAVPLFAIGMILIALCHVPVRFGLRVALVLAAGAVLAALRSRWPIWEGDSLDPHWIWPVLGAMFMFRLMIYLYDVAHEKGPANPVRALSYFFLLPNVCFTLFPVVDYKTFCRTYYNEPALQIYQRGLNWMVRGIVHLLLWRIVYYEMYLDASRVADGADLVRHIAANMGLYLRVSGQFHLVVGLLLMFGFNLPETNRRYFLAAGFTDYWRRVNIYWKDFIMKLFYYPVAFRLKSWGPTWSIVAATICAFGATWFLHSYQTFWVRNEFPLKAQDGAFWGILGALVIANSLYELRKGRRRSLGLVAAGWRDNFVLALQTTATFLALSILWSLWSSDSIIVWLELWQLADLDTLLWGSVLLGGVFLATLALEGMWRSGRPAAAARAPAAAASAAPGSTVLLDWRSALRSCIVPATALLLLSVQSFHAWLGPGPAATLASLFETKPNVSDEQNMVRGYYEDLMDVARANPLLANAGAAQPRNWQMLEKTELYRETDDYRLYELAPSKQVVLNGFLHSTNRWGMRDREYGLTKPPGTYRIAMLGSSTVMGLNVADGEAFEAILEERLNRDHAGRVHARYEVLNFGVNGYNPPSQVLVLERKALAFEPDAIVLVVHLQDSFFAIERLAKSLRRGIEPPDGLLRDIARESRVDAKTPQRWAERRLMPYWPRLYEWAFGRIAERCVRAGIQPILVYLPPIGGSGARRRDAERTLAMARSAGFAVVDLEHALDGADADSLKVAPWDAHPNSKGHRMIGEALYDAFTAPDNGPLGPAAPRRAVQVQSGSKEK